MNVLPICKSNISDSAGKSPNFEAKFGVHKDVVQHFKEHSSNKAYDNFYNDMIAIGTDIAKLRPENITIKMDLARKYIDSDSYTKKYPYILVSQLKSLMAKSQPFFYSTENSSDTKAWMIKVSKEICKAFRNLDQKS